MPTSPPSPYRFRKVRYSAGGGRVQLCAAGQRGGNHHRHGAGEGAGVSVEVDIGGGAGGGEGEVVEGGDVRTEDGLEVAAGLGEEDRAVQRRTVR